MIDKKRNLNITKSKLINKLEKETLNWDANIMVVSFPQPAIGTLTLVTTLSLKMHYLKYN